MIVALLIAAAAPPTVVSDACKNKDEVELVVCGRSGERYRIDPNVLQTTRERDAPPVKPPLAADAQAAGGCVGPQSCRGGTIPLVGMALVAAKAVALAANGDDWREALRTHEDEYWLYQQAEAKRAEDRRIRIGIGAASK